MTVNINLTPKTVAKSMLVIVAFIIGLLAIKIARHSLTLVIVSGFLALALNTPVSWLARHMPKRSRVLSTLVAYIFVLAILTAFAWVTVPPVVKQTQNLAHNLPSYVDNLKDKSHTLSHYINKYHLEDETNKFVNNFTGHLGDYGNNAFGAVRSVLGGIVSILTIIVLTFLMLIDGPQLLQVFWKTYTDKKKLEHHKELVHKMYRVVTGYVNGQVLITTIDALAALIIMLILRQPYALPLAGVVWLTGLIPLVGATLGAIVVVIVAFFHSPINALILLIYFPIYQNIENHTIQPFVQSRALKMSPLLVFTAVVIGISFGGLLAGFLALPIAGCIQVLVVDYYERKNHVDILADSPRVSAKKS
jgi:predicted PurR-regulated permease PerM